MAKKESKPEDGKPQGAPEKEIPQEAWDKFDSLMGKAVGEKGKKGGKKAG